MRWPAVAQIRRMLHCIIVFLQFRLRQQTAPKYRSEHGPLYEEVQQKVKRHESVWSYSGRLFKFSYKTMLPDAN